MTPYLFLYFFLLTPARHSPTYESPATVFVQVEKAGYVPPWSEPPILKGNSIADRINDN